LRALSKILLLEDDILFADTVTDLLQDDGHEVVHVTNGQSAIDVTYNHKFDLYLLDINVPIVDGMTLLKELRDSDDKTPAIFLTSHKNKEVLKRGFLSGADDYITKPFDAEEMLLRIGAVLKRANNVSTSPKDLLYHDALHKCILYNGQELDLSKKEYELLLLLMRHINNTVPKEMILDELWSSSEGGSDGAIRVYITRIKQLIPQMSIENTRGVGYRLVS
jgi:DNA-binding response OmpR family regulator